MLKTAISAVFARWDDVARVFERKIFHAGGWNFEEQWRTLF